MHIDGFTLVAQLINFLLLLWLLKRFLYQPVLQAMQQRQQRLSDLQQQAQQLAAASQLASAQLTAERAQLQAQREAWLTQARAEVEQQRQQWLEQARQSAEQERERLHAQLEHLHASLAGTLRSELRQTLELLLRRALSDLANGSLEACMSERLLAQLPTLPQQPIRVYSSHPLPPDVQARLSSVLPVHSFEVLEQHSGPLLRLEFAEQRLEWSLDSWLAGLEAQGDVH